ncbi:trafficking protein particle complex II-specific subunit 130 homolog isoform X2 [Vitis riparia]|uniref:trafficking protein particle complex II-specific subunit 130 homolog isoform X2 n=1 Tax=Vitis riparia TaxID=96939 RepID=UPI00155AA21F|nr:trafficking protein particle complex II-specific subunit 130 homolog isoform X2 [Vitis riparia]
MKWRVERLKDFDENAVSQNNDEVLYEGNANSENWMIVGRKRGHVSLSTKQGARSSKVEAYNNHFILLWPLRRKSWRSTM